MARKRVEGTETVFMQEQDDMSTAENTEATNRKPEKKFDRMLNAIEDSLSNLASSNDEQEGEDEEDDEEHTELGNLSDDDEPGWVISTISKPVQDRIASFWEKLIRLDELMQPGWGDAANYFCEKDMKYATAKLKVPAVIKPQIDITAATSSPTTFGERMQTLGIVRGQSQILAVTS